MLLLVEDEPLVLLVAQDALEAGGFTVLTATHGREGLEALAGHHNSLAGLVTDVDLGEGPSGWDLARRARELKVCLPVVYTTALASGDFTAQGVPNSLLVQKPYAPAQLLVAISTLIIAADTRSG